MVCLGAYRSLKGATASLPEAVEAAELLGLLLGLVEDMFGGRSGRAAPRAWDDSSSGCDVVWSRQN